MKLDVDVLRYLSKDDFRVLTAVELGMRNVRFSFPLLLNSNFIIIIIIFWILELKLMRFLPLLQHEIVPTELIDRIARLK